MEFYDELADQYDSMTRFTSRMKSEQQVVERWVSRYDISSALDAACGTGLHAMLLARQGVRTVGADLSTAMLDKARKNATGSDLDIEWVEASMQEIGDRVKGTFDAVFCLGNSLPHLLSKDDLNRTLTGFSSVLKAKGILILQILNYEKILKARERIVGVHRDGPHEFIRFYDFLDSRIIFNLLTVTEISGKPSWKLRSTELFPYTLSVLEAPLSDAGFTRIQSCGNTEGAPFNPDDSPNLVLLCTKGG